jgi:Zn-dependent peptidase ImmA (M78 family)
MLLIFAGALLIPRKQLVNELNLFLAKTDPKPQEMIELMGKFNVSPESFYQRLTNIFKDFQLKTYFSFDYLTKRGRYLSD